ncbi:phosphoribosylglycinamide formyltransferase [Kordia zhangzhouensis]|uniref:phosphoribosylglycinamide formyltransferase n=1 Tax=Kordia zhangzhouensis TaxID=1620405 RepID=UPI0006298903|nr:formyltransferase family protein [Kordia zhangzhouensis]
MKKIVFLVSGNGGTLKFMAEAIQTLQAPFEVIAVVADRECGAATYAMSKKINTTILNLKNDGWNDLHQLLQNQKPDIVITTIHKIIPKFILDTIPNGFINLHYSLLPAFKGLIGMRTVQEAKKQHVQLIGATAHYVNEEVDAGKIISQFVFPVDWKQEITEIYDIVFKNACITLLNALYIITEDSKEKEILFNQNKAECLYNPALHYNAQKFDTVFWNKIN